MAGLNKPDYVERAIAVLQENDRGTLHRADQGPLPVPVELGLAA